MPVYVLEYKDKSYISGLSNYNLYIFNENGIKITPETKFVSFLGTINKIELLEDKVVTNSYYKLKEEHLEKNKLVPEIFPLVKSENNYDDPSWNYYENVPAVYESCAVEIKFDKYKCALEPVELPYWCKIKFPYNIDYAEYIHHELPCSISSCDVFELLCSRLIKLAKETRKYTYNDYRNIGIFYFDRIIKIPHKLQIEDWNKQSISGKKQKVVNNKTIPLFKLTKKNNGKDIVCPSFEASNSYDLSKKVEKYINFVIDCVSDENDHICDKCNGLGLIKEKNVDDFDSE